MMTELINQCDTGTIYVSKSEVSETKRTDGTTTVTTTFVTLPPEVNKQASKSESEDVSKRENGNVDEDTLQETTLQEEKRNVSFPDGIALVTGYLEPPDPWKDAPAWTTNELIAAYKNGCEVNGVKPFNKLLQQLQGIEYIGERYEIISLKGEKLDMKHTESLEEILRRVQFRCIDLEASHLDDETAVAIFDMIEYYNSACKLNISYNKNLTMRGWQACSRLLRRAPSLSFLDARNCDLNERYVPFFGRALKLGCFLTTLHLENTYISGRPLLILVAALKFNVTLKELFLADNKLVPTDGIQIGSLLKENHKLQLLDLRNNHLQDVGTAHVCDGLCEQNLGSGLITLVVWNNQITYQGMKAVGKCLGVTDSVETLNLGHNTITNEGIHLLKDGLLTSKSLLRLGLQGTKVTCEGAVALAEVIADNPRLLRLDLRENEIKTAGLMALSLSLKVSESVIRLDMDRETKKDSSMKDYADQQKRLQQDINNYLERNRDVIRKKDEDLRQKMEADKNQRETESQNSQFEMNGEHTKFDDVPYIPSLDKIKRPKLLFMPEHSHEHSLDSPECVPGDLVTSSPVISPLTSPVLTPHLPAGELLLSPQYCETVKARKLFSITRVDETSPSGIASSVSIPVSIKQILPCGQSQMSVDTVSMVNEDPTPTSLCHTLVTETVDNYIHQIVSDGTSRLAICDAKEWKLFNNETNFVSEGFVFREPASEIELNMQTTNIPDLSDSVSKMTVTDRNNSDCVDSEKNGQHLKNLETSPEFESIAFQNLGNDLGCAMENKNEIGAKNGENNDTELHNVHDATDDSDVQTARLLAPAIDSSDILISVATCGQVRPVPHDTGKPDFYTNLTMNGLTQELATVLDSIDTENCDNDVENRDSIHTPDEFERELDAMLANVKSSFGLPATTGVMENTEVQGTIDS